MTLGTHTKIIKTIIHANQNTTIGEAIRDALLIAIQRWENIQLTHQENTYQINVNELILTAHKTDPPDHHTNWDKVQHVGHPAPDETAQTLQSIANWLDTIENWTSKPPPIHACQERATELRTIATQLEHTPIQQPI